MNDNNLVSIKAYKVTIQRDKFRICLSPDSRFMMCVTTTDENSPSLNSEYSILTDTASNYKILFLEQITALFKRRIMADYLRIAADVA